ncbi:class I SAM-dependent methyltransferase [Streptomyces erythrochromogenes]|uniref:class I SAM-dependent methyltransferase n=1 Tax=Streptomyces erythrochromogenes TaxID=285574 RepID=UPI0036FE0DF0
MNLWTKNGASLAEAYASNGTTIPLELVTRALMKRLPSEPCRIADVGGGFGHQAIKLARLGHHVTVLDLDQTMLSMAEQRLSQETPAVRSRVILLLGDGRDATTALGEATFDVACCHSVILYEEDPAPLLRNLVRLVRQGGLVSVLSVNPEAAAMRTGLQGRWQDTVASLQSGENEDSRCLSTYAHRRQVVEDLLEESGAEISEWRGVGVFTDHLTEKLMVEDPAEVYLAEWLAGERDPYRGVARCFHLLAERTASSVPLPTSST